MAFLKGICASIGVLLLLCIIALFCITTWVDPNRFTPWLAQEISQHTGQEVKIGHLSWGFFPHLKVKADQIDLRNSALRGMLFASADSLSFDVKLLPLLYRQVECRNIQLQRATLHVSSTNPVSALLKTVRFSLSGVGDFDLVGQRINMHLQGVPLDQGAAWGKRFIPIDVTGSLNNPVIHIDWTVLTEYLASRKLEVLKTNIEKKAQGWLDKYKLHF